MSFAKLKRNKNEIQKLLSAVDSNESRSEKKSYVDERFWKPTVDKANNGYAVIRFLPASEGNELPWNRYWDHGFKGPTGSWYIEKSLTSIGQQDPVGELNSRLWNSGVEADKETARRQKRRLHYIANVYIVSDPGNPANEGKVFLFQFGKKIFDKIMDVMQPQFQDEEPMNPFDFWDGANFKLKIRDVEGYRNYDKSEFASPSPLSEDDEELEEIYNKLYDLREFTDPEKYKSYDELKTRLMTVLGEDVNRGSMTMKEEQSLGEEMAPRKMKEKQPELETAEDISLSDDNDTLKYFESLAQSD